MPGQTVTSPDVESGGGRVRVRTIHVVYSPRPAAPVLMALEAAPVAIGREPGPGVDLVVPDPEISRLHVRFERDPERDAWRVVDCGSRNGVWIDGVKVDAAELHHGAVVRVGASLLVISDVEIAADQRLAAERAGLLGRSLHMQRVRGEIELVAPRTVGVLVLGDTGVGKERVAEDIHRLSGRSGRFVPVNCAAIPAGVAESELFGHVAGAFTGAAARAEGLFVAAHGGTLFLDEIGELPGALQAKLLRALATGEVRPLGSTEPRRVDVRIVAATHRDLDALVASDAFRADLLARLAAWRIEVPPLRERREDVLGLAATFLGDGVRLSVNAAEALLLHEWPFNVRELENVAASAAVRPSDGVIRAEHLPPAIAARVAHRSRTGATTAPPPLEALIDRSRTPTRDDLVRVLRHLRGNLADVAEFFGKDRRQVYRWLEKHGLDADAYREPD
jgi:transcriptional regulator with GAF, ATPase, and Fis domain